MATTRRAFISATAATLATTAVTAPVALARTSDAEAHLRDLVRIHSDAEKEHDLAYEAWDALTGRYRKSLPEPPQALFERGQDFTFGIGDTVPYAEGRRWYGNSDLIEDLRTTPRTRQDWTNTTEEVDENGKVSLAPGSLPWPEAQARADEIVAAWNEWQDAKEATAEAVGLYEAEERKEEGLERVFETFRAVMNTPVSTLPEALVKAEVVLSLGHHVDGDFNAYVEQYHENNGISPETVALYMLRDLLRMKGQG